MKKIFVGRGVIIFGFSLFTWICSSQEIHAESSINFYTRFVNDTGRTIATLGTQPPDDVKTTNVLPETVNICVPSQLASLFNNTFIAFTPVSTSALMAQFAELFMLNCKGNSQDAEKEERPTETPTATPTTTGQYPTPTPTTNPNCPRPEFEDTPPPCHPVWKGETPGDWWAAWLNEKPERWECEGTCDHCRPNGDYYARYSCEAKSWWKEKTILMCKGTAVPRPCTKATPDGFSNECLEVIHYVRILQISAMDPNGNIHQQGSQAALPFVINPLTQEQEEELRQSNLTAITRIYRFACEETDNTKGWSIPECDCIKEQPSSVPNIDMKR